MAGKYLSPVTKMVLNYLSLTLPVVFLQSWKAVLSLSIVSLCSRGLGLEISDA